MYIKIENNIITEIHQTEVENSYFIEDGVMLEIGWTVGLWDEGKPIGFGSPSIPPTAEQIQQAEYDNAIEEVNNKRNILLQETDWIVIRAVDTSTPMPVDWQVYRQALRDITAHTNYPFLQDEDWPIKPQNI
jgi:hypothetical protein